MIHSIVLINCLSLLWEKCSFFHFVSKIVLTYCKKKLFWSTLRKKWSSDLVIQGWGRRICKNFLDHCNIKKGLPHDLALEQIPFYLLSQTNQDDCAKSIWRTIILRDHKKSLYLASLRNPIDFDQSWRKNKWWLRNSECK